VLGRQHKLEASGCPRDGNVNPPRNGRGKASGRNSLNEATPLGFVDANVLADAILIESAIDEITAEVVRTDNDTKFAQIKELFNSYEPSRQANTLFMMLQYPFTGSYTVTTSNLALLEARSVMTEEYIDRRLSQRRVFRRYSQSQRSRVHLTDEDVAQIYDGIMRFKFKIGRAMVISDEFDLHVAESLVTEFGCKARDAILVATAIKNGCPKFITRDD
jgi:predicted nucleic acid-binding protein